jgi:hypothetical protein
MPFGLKNALATYQRVVNKAFREYLNKFMKLFLDDFSVYFDEAPICLSCDFVLRSAGSLALA